jgi:hypothetical protein
MVNANMSEHTAWPILPSILTGQWYDYVPGWYATVGYTIVYTMIINVVMPFVALGMAWGMPFVFRLMDVGCSMNPYDTKKTSMAQFKQTWSGQDYIIHFKFANVLNVYYVTLMYGMGLPILFPLAAINFFFQWACERIIVAYYMKQPPALDDKLIKNCLDKMQWGPLLFLVNGYWMLSNVQMFDNKWNYKSYVM